MNPNQTKGAVWDQSDLGPYCLQYRLPNISRREKQTTKVVTGRL